MDFSTEQLLNDIGIRTAMRDALRESRPGSKHPIEQGGTVSVLGKTDDILRNDSEEQS